MTVRRLILGAAGLTVAYAVMRELSLVPPEGINPVRQFDLSRYLGKWYEVGRLENRFERGLVQTTAEYSLSSNGTVRVVNRGFDRVRQREKEAIGTAKFIGDQTVGALKVSFFWPFYGGYNVIDLDPEYEWAIIVGSSRKYFWVLSRDPVLSEALRSRAKVTANAAGVDSQQIYWVLQG
jgi:apolipoprotein D and lipocalin family protein